MFVQIPNLLTSEELNTLGQTLATAKFEDGKLTAGWHAKLVKHNQQMASEDGEVSPRRMIIKALQRNPLFQAVARPRQIHSVLLSRYRSGMTYGRHVDNALMGGSSFFRSDISFTVFLNAPSCYEGGQLVLEGADSETPYKLEAGSCIVYPSTVLHRVDPVTEGYYVHTNHVVLGCCQE